MQICSKRSKQAVFSVKIHKNYKNLYFFTFAYCFFAKRVYNYEYQHNGAYFLEEKS